MSTPQTIDILIDLAPFAMYLAVLVKLLFGWRKVKAHGFNSGHGAIFALLALVVTSLLAANVYAFAVEGKTYLSLKVFQMFLVGNWLVYWIVIDFLTRAPEQKEASRESTD